MNCPLCNKPLLKNLKRNYICSFTLNNQYHFETNGDTTWIMNDHYEFMYNHNLKSLDIYDIFNDTNIFHLVPIDIDMFSSSILSKLETYLFFI